MREIIDSAADSVHAFVLDADGIPDIDYTGAQVLADVASELRQRRVALGIARSSHLVQRAIRHPSLSHAIGRDQVYESVEEAVTALAKTS